MGNVEIRELETHLIMDGWLGWKWFCWLWRLRGMGGLGVLRSWIKMDRLIGLLR